MDDNKMEKPSDFMKETIKQRPLNRKKLVRRTMITALMAVIFGLVACVTFLLLEPVISNQLYPKEEPETIVFVEDEENEILPEDMLIDESQMQTEPTQPPILKDTQIEQVLSKMELGVEDYLSLSGAVTEVARSVQNSVVKVIGITSDRDWFDNEYESQDVISGVVIADNGKELLVLAGVKSILDAESLEIVFQNGEICPAQIKEEDYNTGLAVLSVLKTQIQKETLEIALPISLGTSSNVNLPGNPVLAIGSPMGVDNSVSIGIVTSSSTPINLPDSGYKLIGTDIYGSSYASGMLVNLRGQLIGIIDMSYNNSDMKNLVSGIGISELKRVIESLSNDRQIAYLGVYGTDVTKEANAEMQVPFGAYIKKTNMDSPAMNAGIQSGDVVIEMEETSIVTYQDLVNQLLKHEPDEEVAITVMRQGPEGYTPIPITVKLGSQNS